MKKNNNFISKIARINFFTVLSSFLITSCSTYRPETFESKMSRFNGPEKRVNAVPEINVSYLKSGSGNLVGTSRGPASVKTPPTKTNNVTKLEMDALKNLSNKKLYFLALFDQYNQLAKFTPSNTENMKTCAHFHSGIIEQYGAYPDVNQFKSPVSVEMINQIGHEASNGENIILQLPLKKDESHPTVLESFNSNKNQNLHQLAVKAIDVHLSKMNDELKELCKYGSSDNYYVFENLVNYIQDNKMTDSKENLAILLKTTIFANEVIGHAFVNDQSGRLPAGKTAKNFFVGTVSRLNVDWALNYFTVKK